MSTSSLPSYVAPSFTYTPSYSAEPHDYERRVALVDRLRPRPTGNFVKKSRNGDAHLRLTAQDNNIALPTYGFQGCVEGIIELLKTESVVSVEVKVEGRLRLKEIAEGGTTSAKLCLDTTLLWMRDAANSLCPSSLRFSLNLPATFTWEGKTYPLPPTFNVKLSGLPGFTASIDYAVSAIINRSNSVPTLRPLVKSNLLGIHLGSTTVTTPFIHYPRTRPPVPIPAPLSSSPHGFIETSLWRCYESEISAKSSGGQSISTRLYVPASRIFCISEPIPFHLSFQSSARSLAAFLPYAPTPVYLNPKQVTRIQLMRQSSVDVRNTVIAGAKTDMWRVDCIGEGVFRHAGDGSTWSSFTGEITIHDSVKVSGFKACGLSVKDCILFSVTPPEPHRCPFHELREVIPVRLTTDVWTADGTGIGVRRRTISENSVPSMLDEYAEDTHPTLNYNR
ncbi:hypothetical protein Hypma_016341 [Hypsizygus marmoreus]|uniref:Arrestin-like N-terminal domain-containing protein n=1 Tax=Hypsizygus marmoreus TaxID=39966 RepID=A0A369J730_HYPMA|nr:hypothetical protein Hypma_016341 [Hypsizygus marmoreus]